MSTNKQKEEKDKKKKEKEDKKKEKEDKKIKEKEEKEKEKEKVKKDGSMSGGVVSGGVGGSGLSRSKSVKSSTTMKKKESNGTFAGKSFFGKHFNDGGCCLEAQMFVHKCLSWLEVENTDRLRETGLYRISGSLSGINRLKEAAERDAINFIISPTEDTHNVTGVLKLYLREMIEPLVPFHLYDSFIASSACPDDVRDERIQKVVLFLPQDNKVIFDRLFYHLHKVSIYSAENKMDPKNLAVVFAPTILRPAIDSPDVVLADAIYSNQFVASLVEKPDFYLHPKLLLSPRIQYSFNEFTSTSTRIAEVVSSSQLHGSTEAPTSSPPPLPSGFSNISPPGDAPPPPLDIPSGPPPPSDTISCPSISSTGNISQSIDTCQSPDDSIQKALSSPNFPVTETPKSPKKHKLADKKIDHKQHSTQRVVEKKLTKKKSSKTDLLKMNSDEDVRELKKRKEKEEKDKNIATEGQNTSDNLFINI